MDDGVDTFRLLLEGRVWQEPCLRSAEPDETVRAPVDDSDEERSRIVALPVERLGAPPAAPRGRMWEGLPAAHRVGGFGCEPVVEEEVRRTRSGRRVPLRTELGVDRGSEALVEVTVGDALVGPVHLVERQPGVGPQGREIRLRVEIGSDMKLAARDEERQHDRDAAPNRRGAESARAWRPWIGSGPCS